MRYFIFLISFQLLSLMAFSDERFPIDFSEIPTSNIESALRQTGFHRHQLLTLSEANHLLKALMRSGDFASLSIEKDTASHHLIFQGFLKHTISAFQIEGNKLFDDETIVDVLQLKEGSVLERRHIVYAAEELQKKYEERGYYNSEIEILFVPTSSTQSEINISISEGKELRVEKLNFSTENKMLKRSLNDLSKKFQNSILNEKTIFSMEDKIAEILRDGNYLSAQISNPIVTVNEARTLANVTFEIANPWVFRFLFRGNKHFTHWYLSRKIQSEELFRSVSSPASQLSEELLKIYHNEGFSEAKIDFEESHNQKEFLHKIIFQIKEGPRVLIDRFIIEGNISRNQNHYTSKIKEYKTGILKKGYLHRSSLDRLFSHLIISLQNEGFIHARLQTYRIETYKRRQKTYARIYVQIDEGNQTLIRQIRLQGVEVFNRNEILERLPIKTGAPLRLFELEDAIHSIRRFYRDRGYLEVEINPDRKMNEIIILNDQQNQAIVDLKVREGPRIYINAIEIQGLQKTKKSVVLNEITISKGDILTPQNIEESTYFLQKLGIFSSVQISTLEENTYMSERTLLISLRERDPGLFTMGLGLHNDRRTITTRGYAGIAYRNLAGLGRAISLRADPSYSSDSRINFIENRIALSFLEPHIFGRRNRIRVNLIREQKFFNFDRNTRHPIIQEDNSFGLLFEKDLSRRLTFKWTGYSFSFQKKFDRVTSQTVESQNIAKIGPLFELDHRNDTFNPTRGSFSFFNIQYSDPLIGSTSNSDQHIHFIKKNLATTHYIPLNKSHSWVFATSMRAGHIRNLSKKPQSGIPSQEGFFLGGRSTIRGFDSSDLERVPNSEVLGVTSLTDFRIERHSSFFLTKSEFRFPLIQTDAVGLIGGTLFYDGGIVFIQQTGGLLSSKYRDAIGLGVRIHTPIGPVNLEVGFKLNQMSYPSGETESPYAFHFSIGSF